MTERATMRFTLEVFNLTNAASFDILINNANQSLNFNDFRVFGSTLYSSPSGIGIVNKTIGSPRQIQMSLRFSF